MNSCLYSPYDQEAAVVKAKNRCMSSAEDIREDARENVLSSGHLRGLAVYIGALMGFAAKNKLLIIFLGWHTIHLDIWYCC